MPIFWVCVRRKHHASFNADSHATHTRQRRLECRDLGGRDPARGLGRTRRDAKAFSFIELNDGSSLKGIQIIANASLPDYGKIEKITTGAAISVRGKLVASQGQGQKWEVVADTLTVLGEADATYPCRKKATPSNFSARSLICGRGPIYSVRCSACGAGSPSPSMNSFKRAASNTSHTPIITASDCEGAGELFRASTLDPKNPPKTENGAIDYQQDFFAQAPRTSP